MAAELWMELGRAEPGIGQSTEQPSPCPTFALFCFLAALSAISISPINFYKPSRNALLHYQAQAGLAWCGKHQGWGHKQAHIPGSNEQGSLTAFRDGSQLPNQLSWKTVKFQTKRKQSRIQRQVTQWLTAQKTCLILWDFKSSSYFTHAET